MNKSEFIASYCVSNNSALAIIYCNDEIVKSCFIIGDVKKPVYTSKIYYDAAAQPYFKRYNKKYYFNEFMRL